MQNFNQELGFIINRKLYQENKYLLDILLKNEGLIRAVARIKKQTNYRQTNSYALFQEYFFDGKKKEQLSNIYSTEQSNFFLLQGKQIVLAHYLNELILTFARDFDDNQLLYHHYYQALQSVNEIKLRTMEWLFISHFELLPAIPEKAEYYQIIKSHNEIKFIPSKDGYSKEIIFSLYRNNPIFKEQKKLQSIFQSILFSSRHFKNNTRKVAKDLHNLKIKH